MVKNSKLDELSFTGVQCKGYFCRSLKMTGNAEFVTGDSRWLVFLPGLKTAGHLSGIYDRK